MEVTIIYGSTRKNGNTELLAEHVIRDLPAKKIFLKDFHIKDIVDQRHEPQGFTKVEDDYDRIIESVMGSDILIFATPLYWYGMSSVMKTFIDRWSQTIRDEEFPRFKELMGKKKAYLLVVGGDEPRIKGLPLVDQFKYICEFIGMEFKDYIIGEGVKPQEILNDEEALEEADQLNRKLIVSTPLET
ncbi:flavodoxin family protein [Pseudalkalibacillus salsuginis]|uniref:flavodoxin family protein n=1 Tax=Pseudalkalibacillus salsuginis TaxID=2910972 RepID=UPI001F34A78B|nr:flavodoxin family protein [Pseudalkalibacillus salsuginis]MCF6409751.1 flavodoxin family protein [Pseudalkalibacillus salsuginis]